VSSGDGATVAFTAMVDGTAEEYQFLHHLERRYVAQLPDRLMATLESLRDSLGGYKVSRLEHSLQTATRARRSGADVDWVVAALLHDIGDVIAPENHSDLAAAVLQPYVRPEVHWAVLHHGIFQMYYYAHHTGGDRDARDRYRDHEWAGLCERFCAEWDQASFDPDYPTDSLESFRNDVVEVFSRAAWSVAPTP
jgi:predicted HD phosphohydrolase